MCAVESQYTLDNYGLELDGYMYASCAPYVPENSFSGECRDCCFQHRLCYDNYWNGVVDKCIYGKKNIDEWACFELFDLIENHDYYNVRALSLKSVLTLKS